MPNYYEVLTENDGEGEDKGEERRGEWSHTLFGVNCSIWIPQNSVKLQFNKLSVFFICNILICVFKQRKVT